ncbi:MAG: phospholipid carrier-dependent glycosyltransferase [Thermoproteota archaeon]
MTGKRSFNSENRETLVTKQDLTIMVILTTVFFLMAAYNLGSTDVPVTSWKASEDESFYIDFGHFKNVSAINILVKKADIVILEVYYGSPGNWSGPVSIYIGSDYPIYYSLERKNLNLNCTALRFVFRFPCEIVEIAIMDEEDRVIPVAIENIVLENDDYEALKLFDEQNKIAYPSTYLSQTYFDEIYSVRTAEEYIRFEEPYECVHPPLGKLIIAAGILIFGYSPFGWRIAGVIFATFMIPAIYVFGKIMFKTWIAAFITAFLLIFEFMHFTMARIATTDTFLVFFSIMSHLFFFAYFNSIIHKKADNRLLFLAVLFFALGFSTKWIIFSGFVGQISILIALRLRELFVIDAGWNLKIKEFLKHPVLLIGVFIGIAAIIYLLTYIPYMIIGHTLEDVYNQQWAMYNYHRWLTASHPFSSPWWSWPIIQRPVWLYVSYLPQGLVSTIVCMGNPAIWWFGIFCMGLLIVTIVEKTVRKKKVDFTSIFIVAIFLFQWLQYAFISRCVFLYHFYSNVPFLILAITYFLNKVWKIKYGKLGVSVYLIVVVVFFALFYPVISGYPIPFKWRDNLRWFESWIF